jgi:hypothetical protein
MIHFRRDTLDIPTGILPPRWLGLAFVAFFSFVLVHYVASGEASSLYSYKRGLLSPGERTAWTVGICGLSGVFIAAGVLLVVCRADIRLDRRRRVAVFSGVASPLAPYAAVTVRAVAFSARRPDGTATVVGTCFRVSLTGPGGAEYCLEHRRGAPEAVGAAQRVSAFLAWPLDDRTAAPPGPPDGLLPGQCAAPRA